MGSGIKLPDYVGENGVGKLERSLGKNQTYVLEKKYLQRDNNGVLNETPTENIYRMARTMAEVEKQYGKSQKEVDQFTEEFYHMIDNGEFSPAGRIWTNAGTDIKGLFNCYVLPVEDDIEAIYDGVKHAAIIHKNGGGTGYNFSNLRSRGTYVQNSKGIASGPVSFIEQYDKETEIINSGNRRGANMGILSVHHPNIFDFIYAKSYRGKITNFNVSVGATERFMQAVANGEYYDLEFPKGTPFHYSQLEEIIVNIEENKMGGANVGELPRPSSLKFEDSKIIPGKTNVIDSQTEKVAGKVNENGSIQLYAPYVFDQIAELAWETADPGMIFLDEINKYNPLPQLGDMEATNPCGEQPLHPHDACNLGSLVMSNMIKYNDNGSMEVDYDKIEKTVIPATRFMDNVNDANKGPIPEIEKTVLAHRRIGMGIMGWADMLIELGVPYDSQEALDLARNVMGFVTDTAKKASVELAKEKGVFPAFEGSRYDTGKDEDRVRNVERTTIAPNGTISMLYNVSSGIEPIPYIIYEKNIRGGDKLLYTTPLFEKEIKERGLDLEDLVPLIRENNGSIQGLEEVPEDMQKVFKTAQDLSYESHILIQAAFQEKTDNAVSKTINMSNSVSVEDIRDAYLFAWKNNLKGVTVYRDGSKDIQVLSATSNKDRRKFSRNGLAKLVMKNLNSPRPDNVVGRTAKVKTPYSQKAFITLNFVEDGKGGKQPYESFINVGKAGGDLTAITEGYGRLISVLLKLGVDPLYITDQLIGIGGETQDGFGEDRVRSLPDSIGKGIKKIAENGEAKLEEVLVKDNGITHSGNLCPECGGPLIHEENCEKCPGPMCSYSKC